MSDPLAFTPVPRKFNRRGGWTAERQQGFVTALAEGLDPEKAAQTQGLTGNGAYQLRKAAGAESFAAAWDAAIDMARAGRRGEAPAAPAAAGGEEEDPLQAALETDRIIAFYGLKLAAERQARLEGRIIEADYYCRQLTCIEVTLSLGEGGFRLMKALRSGEYGELDIAATAMSHHIGQARRAIWREKGEVDRPPPSLVARLTGEKSEIGLAHSNAIWGGPGTNYQEEIRRQRERERLNARVQGEWEERARADAAAWAEREAEIGAAPESARAESGPSEAEG